MLFEQVVTIIRRTRSVRKSAYKAESGSVTDRLPNGQIGVLVWKPDRRDWLDWR